MAVANTPAAREHLQRFLEEAAQQRPLIWKVDAANLAAGATILALPREEQVNVVLEALGCQVGNINELFQQRSVSSGELAFVHTLAIKSLISALLRKRLPFTEENLIELTEYLGQANRIYSWQIALPGVLRAVEDYVADHGLSNALAAALRELLENRNLMKSRPLPDDHADSRKARQRIVALLQPDKEKGVCLSPDEVWTRHLLQAFQGMEAEARAAWQALLEHCSSAGTAKPSKKWLTEAEKRIAAIGTEPCSELLQTTLAQVGKPGTPQKTKFYGHVYDNDPTLVHNTHSDLLRGLVWCTSLVSSDPLIGAVGDAAEICFKKIPNVGPRAPKIGNACLWALSAVQSMTAVAQLSRLKTKAKHVSIRKQLGKALDSAAQNAGMAAEELEEVAVPTCGLTALGELVKPLGDFTGTLRIDGLKAALSWQKPDGKVQGSVPAAVKQDHAGDLKLLKQAEKEINTLLPVQRDRIERLFLQERAWSFADFRSRFLDHPLVGTVARRLLWRFSDGDRSSDGIWHNGRIVDENDQPLDWLTEQSRVAVWHPVFSSAARVQAWRQWLETHQVRQPFKQAHRELYILTDAERRTDTYSNRFAAHVLRQHQFAALCQQRGWRYSLQGEWDSHNTPFVELPRWELRAEFWVEAAAVDNVPAGVYTYVTTDQVRFTRGAGAGPLRLADVPPLVFSEVMRDVDLFVGVASVGNDPNWADGGPDGRYRDYWQSYSFGELSATAQTRRQVLERLIPRLKIAERCSLSDRFLIVQGKRRTYKIHLGSGNILMAPNDQYLCIVPDRHNEARDGKVFLPFEGDQLLSIILSKALLLAEDWKITDPTILTQIGRG